MKEFLNHKEITELELTAKQKQKERLEINTSIKEFLAKGGKIKKYNGLGEEC